MSMVFCSNCGQKNTDDSNFCFSCGSSLSKANDSNSARSEQAAANSSYSNNQQTAQGSSTYAVLGWVFTGISILLVPILFGAGGVIFGYLHSKVDKTHGNIIMIAAIACGLFGTILGSATAGY